MNAQALKNKQGKLWLNVASSHYVIEEFVNLDNSIFLKLVPIYPIVKPLLRPGHRAIVKEYQQAKARACMVIHDCRKRLDLPDESADHILCSHFLEHVYPTEAKRILKDFHRVLKKGGTAHIIVPNLGAIVTDYATNRAEPDAANRLVRNTIFSHESPPSFKYRVLEALGYQGMQHRWMYDNASLGLLLQAVGFQLLENTDSPSAAVRANDGDASAHLLVRKP